MTWGHARMADPLPAPDPVQMSNSHATGLEQAFRHTQRAGPGSTVEVVDRAGRTTIYELVVRPPGPIPKRVTILSPEGLALLGVRPGDALTIPADDGRRRRVSVVDVTPPAWTDQIDSSSTIAT